VVQYKKIYWLHWWDEGAPYRRKLQRSITLFRIPSYPTFKIIAMRHIVAGA
jgi:hypothetical protein